MCGIIAVIRKDKGDARIAALARYRFQKSRGSEGYGFVALKNGVIGKYDRAEEESDILNSLDQTACDALIFHHRLPTSTPNLAECAHPIKVSDDRLKHDYYMIHNGIIWNDDEWKKKHNAEGYRYSTEIELVTKTKHRDIIGATKWNDSEVLAVELAFDLDSDGKGIYLDGSIAFICLQVEKNTNRAVRLFWGRNISSPMVYYEDKGSIILSSEGVGKDVPTNTLFSLELSNGNILERPYQVGLGRGENVTADIIHVDDMDDEYYKLIEESDELRRRISIAEYAGADATSMIQDLDDIERDLKEMEMEFDTHNLPTLLG